MGTKFDFCSQAFNILGNFVGAEVAGGSMRGCPVIIAVFQIGPHAFPLQSPAVGLAGGRRRGRKGGAVRDC